MPQVFGFLEWLRKIDWLSEKEELVSLSKLADEYQI